MNKNFTERLNEYLESECSDFDMAFDYKWNEDTCCCEVRIYRTNNEKLEKYINFRYSEFKDVLKIELSEDSFIETEEFNYTVKYFWMLVSPSLFPNN